MSEKAQQIKYFLFSQSLADGIRITIEIVLPAIILSQFGRLDIGLLLSTGAFCVSLSDAPGPLDHKLNGMMYCNVFVFLMVLLIGFANHNLILQGFLVLFASFFFTMFSVFGTRATAIGTAALLIMILRMDDELPMRQMFVHSLLTLAGGVWYMAISLIFFKLKPLRQAQRSLGNCVHETAKLLLVKADLYDTSKKVNEEYKRLIDQQVIVNEKQDEVRELLFKNKKLVKNTSKEGHIIFITFTSVVDLYEQITATWYDYNMLREKFSSTNILPEISNIIKEIAYELDVIGLAIQSNIPYKKKFDLIPALNALKLKIDNAKIENTSTLVLKKILINLRNLGDQANAISNYFAVDTAVKIRTGNRNDYSKFVSHQVISFQVFKDNLHLSSAIFRHALRMMIACIMGFVIVKFISYGHHSYWILLTIIFILKPGYSITKQRNIERIAGTVAGGLLGILLIATVHDRGILLALIVFFMIGTYTFQRLNYIVTVIFTTPFILILFNFLGLGFINIVEERILDTAIASIVTFFASYFLFPNWEFKQLDTYMVSVLKANIIYLQKLKHLLTGNNISTIDYKLARKELYVSTANLSAAFKRMLSEPKNKQQHATEINEFLVLNNVFSANVASLFTIKKINEESAFSKEIIQPINRSITILTESLVLMNTFPETDLHTANIKPVSTSIILPDQQLIEHVAFIFKLSVDIKRVVKKISL